MRRALLGALGCSLGWAGLAPAGEEAPWRAAPPPALTRPAVAEWTAPSRPAAVLDRPCPLAPAEAPSAPVARLEPPAPSAPVRSIAYNPSPVVARGQAADIRPMPLGPAYPSAYAPAVPVSAAAQQPEPPLDTVAPQVPLPGMPLAVPPGPVVAPPGPGGHPFVGGPIGAAPCSAGACFAPGCCPAPPASRCFVYTDYLMWWVKGDHAPPLLTTGMPSANGIIGPGTAVVYGGDRGSIFPSLRSGVRVGGGFWLDPCACWGVDASLFTLSDAQGGLGATSSPFNGNPLLARPFFALNAIPGANTPGEFSEVVAGPGTMFGSVRVDTTSQLWGGDVNLRRNLFSGCFGRLDALVGFRYADLRESLAITESVLGPAQATDILAAVGNDTFRTRNAFYGGQLGLTGEARCGRWFVNGYAKVGLGNTHETLDISGGQFAITTRPGIVSAPLGNLLALPTNINHYERDRFSVLPEGGVNIGCHLTERLRVYTGYSFLYWNHVARPGDQIDRSIDVTQVPNFPLNPPALPLQPGLFRPITPFQEKSFWAQGINFGLEFNW